MNSYASFYHDQSFYIFGGSSINQILPLNQIGRLDAVTRTWSLAGYLKQRRLGHGVIFDGMHFLVVGGFLVPKENEVCLPFNGTVTCSTLGHFFLSENHFSFFL